MGHSLGNAVASLVDHVQRQGALTGFFRGTETRDMAHELGFAQGQGKRTPHQAAANQGQALEAWRGGAL
jgi:hypothetical protein